MSYSLIDESFVVNRPIKVLIGRSTYLPTDAFKVRRPVGADCDIRVLENHLIASSGEITPGRFPCNYSRDAVKYTHFGASFPSEDTIHAQLKLETETSTLIIPLAFSFEIDSSMPYNCLLQMSPLTVPFASHVSDPINENVLRLFFDNRKHSCSLAVDARRLVDFPRYGSLTTMSRETYGCDEFFSRGIRYRRAPGQRSMNKDQIPMRIKLTDKNTGDLEEEFFYVAVAIAGGAVNQAPLPTSRSRLLLEVKQMTLTAITAAVLSAVDLETSSSKLLYKIVKPLNENEGLLLRTDDVTKTVNQFYHSEIQQLKIAYIPPPTSAVDKPKTFSVEMVVFDIDGASSTPFSLIIVVYPIDNLLPRVTRNTGLFVIDSNIYPIDGNYLKMEVGRNIGTITIHVVAGLSQGTLLVRGEPSYNFTVTDLTSKHVQYIINDRTNKLSENVIFRVTDGYNEFEFLFPINIATHFNDHPLTSALTICEAKIADNVFKSSVKGEAAWAVRYTVEAPYVNGVIILKELSDSWLGGKTSERVVYSWTQQDINNEKLYYSQTKHRNSQQSTSVHNQNINFELDEIKFRVRNVRHPHASSRLQKILIKILPLSAELCSVSFDVQKIDHTSGTFISDAKNSLPIVDSQTHEHAVVTKSNSQNVQIKLEVFERESIFLTDNILDNIDTNNVSEFVISSKPTEGFLLVSGRPANRFTEDQLSSNNVTYHHDSRETGLKSRTDNFTLDITEVDSELGSTILVSIIIKPVDNAPPNITASDDLHVLENQGVTLDDIVIHDPDTHLDNVSCSVTVQPRYGYIEKVTIDTSPKTSNQDSVVFTVDDINEKRLRYVQNVHDGIEHKKDEFTLQCTDGKQVSPAITVSVATDPVNDEKPEEYKREFTVYEGGIFNIDLPTLSTANAAVRKDNIRYIISQAPRHGEILLRRDMELIPATNFTQLQVENGFSVAFQHFGTDTKRDRFVIQVTDGEHVIDQVIDVTVLPVNDETPHVAANNGLHLGELQSKKLSTQNLETVDSDTNNTKLFYLILEGPTGGQLQMLDDKTGQVLTDLSTGQNFTQHDIDIGSIRYITTELFNHDDVIKFGITDGHTYLNVSFHVTKHIADSYQHSVISKGIVLPEQGGLNFNASNLGIKDVQDSVNNITYYITRQPHNGRIETSDNPEVPLTFFYSQEIENNKLFYVSFPDSLSKMDSFEFEALDDKSNIIHIFKIAILDARSKLPVLTYRNLTCEEGSSTLITASELSVVAPNIPQKKLGIIVTTPPMRGDILLDHSKIVSFFTMEDISNDKVSYHHDSSETVTDKFSFIVSAASHASFLVYPDVDRQVYLPQSCHMTIIPVDDQRPQIVVNRGAHTLTHLPGFPGTILGAWLTSGLLRAEDKDSTAEGVTFVITRPTRQGRLVDITDGDRIVDLFTQGSVYISGY